MTRKDYNAIAAALNKVQPCKGIPMEQQTATQLASVAAWEQCVEAVSGALYGTNPLYNASKFRAACKGE
jgi:hypothetical protein